ncbi:MAG TPA: GTP cyclohydrolase I FolE [Lachnospiraceae bacterium]|nr:GTP cyclohydrolase I FolE [Lachnospiraceae bacterium]
MIDKEKAEKAITMLLEAIGEDVTREGLVETPMRVAKMYEEITKGYDEDAKTHLTKIFNVKSSDIVLEKDIEFYSLCEHHLLPFFGKVHIAYLPNEKVVGLSKLARTVETFARRLQLQEQMTNQIADSIEEFLSPSGIMVVIEAEHTCMTMRGIKKVGSKTVTYSMRGKFVEDVALQNNILNLIKS